MTTSAETISGPTGEWTRRHLTVRQSEIVHTLVDAAIAEVTEHGYDGLTVRNVARRAGVAAATAYTYFSSKDHLLAEVLWRRVQALPPVHCAATDNAVTRIERTLENLGLFTADDPALSAAFTTAMLGTGPDVHHLRLRVGVEIHERLAAALGPGCAPGILDALELAYSGAMLQAGMGHLRYDEIPQRLARVAHLVLGDTP